VAFAHTSTVMATGDGELPVHLHPTAGSRVPTAAATRQLPARSTAPVAAGPPRLRSVPCAALQWWPAASCPHALPRTRSAVAAAGCPGSYLRPVS